MLLIHYQGPILHSSSARPRAASWRQQHPVKFPATPYFNDVYRLFEDYPAAASHAAVPPRAVLVEARLFFKFHALPRNTIEQFYVTIRARYRRH
jgi:hypothetical protein